MSDYDDSQSERSTTVDDDDDALSESTMTNEDDHDFFDSDDFDESEPDIVALAKVGDLKSVQSLVEKEAHSHGEVAKKKLLNATRWWREVDYKASGLTKEHDWEDMTALAWAAERVHDTVVEYLLRQGADPTIRGCPREDYHANAFEVAADLEILSYKKKKNTIKSWIQQDVKKEGGGRKSASDYAERIFLEKSAQLRVKALLDAVRPYWKASDNFFWSSDSTAYGEPTDYEAMILALDAVPANVIDKESADFACALEKVLEVQGEIEREERFRAKKRKAEEAEIEVLREKYGTVFTGTRCPACGKNFGSSYKCLKHVDTSMGKAHKRHRQSLN